MNKTVLQLSDYEREAMNGKELRLWRKNAGLSLDALAAMTGVGKSTISRFENGKEILGTSYALLGDAMAGNAIVKEETNSLVKIKFHIQQIEMIIESEDS